MLHIDLHLEAIEKNVIFLRENAIFYKIDVFFFEVKIDEKHEKARNNLL